MFTVQLNKINKNNNNQKKTLFFFLIVKYLTVFVFSLLFIYLFRFVAVEYGQNEQIDQRGSLRQV